MKIKKNSLYNLILLLAALGMVSVFSYRFVSGNLVQGAFLFLLLGIGIFLRLLSALYTRLHLEDKFSKDKKWVKYLEGFLVILVVVLAELVRMELIREMPEQYLQDEQTYYEVAQALLEGNLQNYGEQYCDAIAASPTVMGYSYFLMWSFRIFGVGVRAGQYLNVLFSVACVFFAYRIAKEAGGRMAGFAALILCAFQPSKIAAVSVLSPECCLLFFWLLCLWIFMWLLREEQTDAPNALRGILFYVVLGLLLAVAVLIHAVSVLLLAGMVFVLLPQKMKMPAKPLNDIPLTQRMLGKGWIRCLLILIPYFVLTGVLTSNIEMTIDRSVSTARIACGSELLQEISADVQSSLALTQDERALEQYGERIEETGAWEEKLEQAGNYNQVIYAAVLFFGLLSLWYLLHEAGNPMILPVLLLDGCFFLCLFSENGEEYQSLISWIFILLAAMSAGYLFHEGWSRRKQHQTEEEFLQKELELEHYKQNLAEEEEERLCALRKEIYANRFDMKEAIREGHVIMTVSQGYEKEETQHGE